MIGGGLYVSRGPPVPLPHGVTWMPFTACAAGLVKEQLLVCSLCAAAEEQFAACAASLAATGLRMARLPPYLATQPACVLLRLQVYGVCKSTAFACLQRLQVCCGCESARDIVFALKPASALCGCLYPGSAPVTEVHTHVASASSRLAL